jgi:hypothetical protein
MDINAVALWVSIFSGLTGVAGFMVTIVQFNWQFKERRQKESPPTPAAVPAPKVPKPAPQKPNASSTGSAKSGTNRSIFRQPFFLWSVGFAMLSLSSLYVERITDRSISLDKAPYPLSKTDFTRGEVLLKIDGEWKTFKLLQPFSKLKELKIPVKYSSDQTSSRSGHAYSASDSMSYFFVQQSTVVGIYNAQGYLAANNAYRGQAVDALISTIGKPNKIFNVTGKGFGFDTLMVFDEGKFTLNVMARKGKVDGLSVEAKQVKGMLVDDYKWGLEPAP